MDKGIQEVLLGLLALIHVVVSQLIGPTSITTAQGSDVSLECSVTPASPTFFNWYEVLVDSTRFHIFSGGFPVSPPLPEKYDNFNVSEVTGTSVMSIRSIALEDDGVYRCVVPGQDDPPDATVTVEVQSALSMDVTSPMVAGTSYEATCEALGGRPQEEIEWYLNDVRQTQGVSETYPTHPNEKLSTTRSSFTFTPTAENNGHPIYCATTGHTVTELNQQLTSVMLNVEFPPPVDGILDIELTPDNCGADLQVTCTRTGAEPNPALNSYQIYSGENQIHNSTTSPLQTCTSTPDVQTEFRCVASNYLGSTTTTGQYPPSTTIPTPTTGQTTILGPVASTKPTVNGTDGNIATTVTTRGQENTDPTPTSDPPGLNIGAIVGGVIGGLVAVGLIVLLVCLYKKGIICQKSKSGSGYGSTHGPKENKVATSTNGKEKSAPKPTPRKSMEVMHTTQNPGGDEYAMVSKPQQSGGGGPDYADAGPNGRGQNDSNLHYADIDLSDKAGHTERHVPKNDKDVVVYSSILV